MTQPKTLTYQPAVKRKVFLGLAAIFFIRFTTIFFTNALNIAQPAMISEFNGMGVFSWYLALPALAGAVSTLLFGKLSDIYGRKILVIVSLSFFMLGSFLGAVSTNMTMVILARVVNYFGFSALPAIATIIIGDLFGPSERAKWMGLISIPAGIASAIAPTIGGYVTESAFGWRGLFWGILPLILIAAILAIFGVPGRQDKQKQKIDFLGAVVMTLAATAMIIGGPWLGEPEKVMQGIILLALSIVGWIVFVIVEKKAEAPILDVEILFDRTFITVAGAAFLSFFGMLGVMTYSPIFAQEVMGVSPTLSGSMLTPFNLVMTFMGVPTGFLLSKVKRYKLIFIISYGILALMMLIIWGFTANTPVWLFMVVMGIAGFGLGAIPTLNTLTVQSAVSKQLMGAAIGALFFFLSLGMAVAPSILGLAQNAAIDLGTGLKNVFLIGAVTMILALALISTIPKISLGEKEGQV